MKTERRFLVSLIPVILIMLVLNTYHSVAQSGQRPDRTVAEKAEMQTNMIKKKLNLTEKQKVKVYEINLKYAKKAETILGEGRSRDTMRKLRDMSERRDSELKAVLDEVQYEQYLILKGEMMEKIKERRKSGSGRHREK